MSAKQNKLCTHSDMFMESLKRKLSAFQTTTAQLWGSEQHLCAADTQYFCHPTPPPLISATHCSKKRKIIVLKYCHFSTRNAMNVLRNNEAPSRNHCCHGNEIRIIYSECVSLFLVIQHEMRMHRIILSSVACLILPCLLINSIIFKNKETEKLLNIKFVFWRFAHRASQYIYLSI